MKLHMSFDIDLDAAKNTVRIGEKMLAELSGGDSLFSSIG
jgi:hypothetical protein